MNLQEKMNMVKGVLNGTILPPVTHEMVEQRREADLKKIWAFFDRANGNEYTEKRMLSYSFLKHVDSVRFPKKEWGNKEKNFALGRAFEDMLTDNLDVAEFPNLETNDFKNLQRMCENAKQNECIAYHLRSAMQQVEFETVLHGYKVKGIRDFQGMSSVMDLKSTSATTVSAFERACVDFGYYTQGYMYSNDPEINEYFICGVSKKGDITFTVEMQPADYELGEKEFLRLLENLAYYGIAEQFKA